MEIAPNDTIPAHPPHPGASPHVHIPRVGDGQTWPLASAGIAVAVAAITRRPDNYSDFFLVILTFAGLMPRVLRYSSATPSPPHQPSSNISLGASPRRRNRRYHIPGCTAPIVALLHRCRRSSTWTRCASIVILLVIIFF